MALPESTDPVKLITEELIQSLVERAGSVERRRTNFNFHPDLSDNPHRFLNVLARGTYVAPHRHRIPPKAESFVILRGELAFFLFQDDGRTREIHILGDTENCEALGVDIAPDLWHSLVVLSEFAVCFEVKPGPYNPTEDKEFAPWAPREGEPGVADYLKEREREVLVRKTRSSHS